MACSRRISFVCPRYVYRLGSSVGNPYLSLGSAALKQIVDALLEAQFPLIITAHSGRNPKTVPLLAELSSLLAIGVYTSCPSAVCIPWTHPHYIGTSYGGKNELLDHADLLILLDVDIPWVDTKGNKPRDDAQVFVIDSDPLKTTFGWSHVDADLLCKADAEVALSQLIAAVEGPELKTRAASKLSARQARLQQIRSDWVSLQESAEQVKSLSADGTTPTVPFLLASLRNIVAAQTPSQGENVLWVNEAISNYPLTWAYLRPEVPGSVLQSGGSSLGYCLGASVGAYLGGIVSDKKYDLIAAIVGDGTFLFGIPASAYWLANRNHTVGTPWSRGVADAHQVNM